MVAVLKNFCSFAIKHLLQFCYRVPVISNTVPYECTQAQQTPDDCNFDADCCCCNTNAESDFQAQT